MSGISGRVVGSKCFLKRTTFLPKGLDENCHDIRDRSIILYRRFMRLKSLIPKPSYNRDHYSKYLKFKFTKSYAERRFQVLGIPKDQKLSDDLKRGYNSLDFLNKGFLGHSQILGLIETILLVEHGKEAYMIRYKSDHDLVNSISRFQYHENDRLNSKKGNDFKGIRTFDVALMRLNESSVLDL